MPHRVWATIPAKEEYKGSLRVSEKGIGDRSRQDSSEDMRRIRAAILAGDYFPDCPGPRLAYQQILTAFGETPRAFKLAVHRMAGWHSDSWTEKLCHKSIELDPKDTCSWFNLGNLLCDMNRLEEAETAFRRASELDPENPYQLANLGRLLAVIGDAQGVDATRPTAGPRL